MSHAKTIHAAYDAWTRRDLAALEAVVHPECVARPILGGNIDDNEYRGHEGARRWLDDINQSWETLETRVVDIDEHGDRALCTFHLHARGRASGIVVDSELFHLIEFREGLIFRLEAFRERAPAVAALAAT